MHREIRMTIKRTVKHAVLFIIRNNILLYGV